MRKIDFRNDVLPLKNVLFRLAQRITLNREEAEDVVQETMIKVWNVRDEWQTIDSIEAYSLKICRNLAIDKTRAKANENLSLDDGMAEGHERPDTSYEASPEHQAIVRDKVEQVKRLIEALPEKQRSIIKLRDFEGKPYKEIAEILGITEQQVKVYLFRARHTIKEKYIATDNYGLQVH